MKKGICPVKKSSMLELFVCSSLFRSCLCIVRSPRWPLEMDSRFVSVTLCPISFPGSVSCSSLPLLKPPPPWPLRWQWWRARWLFLRCRVGYQPMPAMPQPAVAGHGTSRCGSRQCGGGERTRSCWRHDAAHSHSSTGSLEGGNKKRQKWMLTKKMLKVKSDF